MDHNELLTQLELLAKESKGVSYYNLHSYLNVYLKKKKISLFLIKYVILPVTSLVSGKLNGGSLPLMRPITLLKQRQRDG